MKSCPTCGAMATDDATMCFECLYSFELMSHMAMTPVAADAVVPEIAEAVPVAEVSLPVVAPSDYEVVVEDETGVRTFDFDSGSLHVGRLPVNEIVLNDRTVSRRHLHIFFERGEVWVEDFGSPNRAYVNGAPVTGRLPFRPGDDLVVRSAKITLRSLSAG